MALLKPPQPLLKRTGCPSNREQVKEVPTQLPSMQTSLMVSSLPSSQGELLGFRLTGQAPARQGRSSWHWDKGMQATLVQMLSPKQTPDWQRSLTVSTFLPKHRWWVKCGSQRGRGQTPASYPSSQPVLSGSTKFCWHAPRMQTGRVHWFPSRSEAKTIQGVHSQRAARFSPTHTISRSLADFSSGTSIIPMQLELSGKETSGEQTPRKQTEGSVHSSPATGHTTFSATHASTPAHVSNPSHWSPSCRPAQQQ